MADELFRRYQQIMSMVTQDAEGNVTGLSPSFDQDALMAILAEVPKTATHTFHEQIARFGEFGVYRVAMNLDNGTVLESPNAYNIILGDVTVPSTVSFEEVMVSRTGPIMMVGAVAQGAVTRENVIARVQKIIARRERYDGGATIDRSGLTEEEEHRALRSIARSQRENQEWVERVRGALSRLTGDDTRRDENG